MPNMKNFTSRNKPTWCPGCGNHGLLMALKNALAEIGGTPENTLAVYGVGCAGNMANWINSNTFHGLHGRALPVATGARLSNPSLTIIAESGDGDGYGIGLSHFIHACRRNLDILYIVHNNQIYGLTTGQTSPTSEKGFISQSTPHGAIEMPINPLALAVSSDATYVARGYVGDVTHLTSLLADGIKHKGFALVDVLQPCFTFNKVNTFDFFKERVYQLPLDRELDNKIKALELAFEWGDKIPTGLFYKVERPTYGSELPQIKEKPLFQHEIKNIDITHIMESLV